MIRILQLLDARADFQTQRCADDLHRGLGGEFRVDSRTIGRGGTYRSILSAVLALRGTRREEFDLIHALGPSSLAAAALGNDARVIYTQTDGVPLRWLRAVMSYRDVQAICPTATLRRICVERGLPLDRCHLIRPGVDFARIKPRRDPRLRRALGIAEEDFVLLAAGESTRAADHRQAAWATSILHVVDERYRVLLWGRGDRVRSLVDFGNHLRQPRLVCVAEQRLGRLVEFEELLPAADMILVPARGAVATLPISIAMAAALPIVGVAGYTVGELLEDRHNALLAAPGSPRLLARRVLDLREDSRLQWSLADMARSEAYEYFSLTRFLNQYRAVFRQCAAGQSVEVPEPPPGPAQRFAASGG